MRKNVVRKIETPIYKKSSREAKVTFKDGIRYGPAGVDGCGRENCTLPFKHGHPAEALRADVYQLAQELQKRFSAKELARIDVVSLAVMHETIDGGEGE